MNGIAYVSSGGVLERFHHVKNRVPDTGAEIVGLKIAIMKIIIIRQSVQVQQQ